MANVNYHLRDLNAKTPQRVWAVFFIENKMVKINSNLCIHPELWSKSKKGAIPSYEQSGAFNKQLREKKDFLELEIEKQLNGLRQTKRRFFKDSFQASIQEAFNDHFKIGEIKPKTPDQVVDFISFINKYIKDHSDLEEGTLQTYRGTRRNVLLAFELVPPVKVKQWLKMNLRQRKLNPDFLQASKMVEFDEVDEDWFLRFKNWMLNAKYRVKRNGIETEVSYSKNYIAKEIAILKRFAIAAEGKYIKNSSFRKVSASWEEADTIHLSWAEIEQLKSLDFDSNSMEGKVRNLFVYNCYCGLRYSDLTKLDEGRFTKVQDQLYIKLRMKKTDEIILFPVLKSAEEIMKLYDYKLPTVCEPIFNEKVKEICKLAGITNLEIKRETRGGKKVILTLPKYQMVSSHTGRRSFATNFEEDGVPVQELMNITGHTTEKAFRRYVKRKTSSKFTGFMAVGANR